MYIYQNCNGGFYTSKRLSNNKNTLLGSANTKTEAWNVIKDIVDVRGNSGCILGYTLECAKKFLDENF